MSAKTMMSSNTSKTWRVLTAVLILGCLSGLAWAGSAPGPAENWDALDPERLKRFGGRLHPLLVHFPIALLLVAATVELLRPRRQRPSDSGIVCLFFGGLGGAAAAWCGWMFAEYEPVAGRLQETLFLHRWAGVAAASLAIPTWLLGLLMRRKPVTSLMTIYRLGVFLAAVAVSLAGYWGGYMVWGPNHLLEVFEKPVGEANEAIEDVTEAQGAADPLPLDIPDTQAQLDAAVDNAVEDPEASEADSAAPASAEPIAAASDSDGEQPVDSLVAGAGGAPVVDTEVAVASPGSMDYAADIAPLFEASCYECHGPTGRAKGGLRLSDTDEFFVGDSEWWIIQPGDAAASELYRRITLPVEDEDFMPPEGEPLTPEEVERVRLWIDEGAQLSGQTAVESETESAAAEAPAVSPALSTEAVQLVLDDTQRAARDAAIERISATGAYAGRLGIESDEVEVNLALAIDGAGDESLDSLAGLEPCLVALDLSRSAVSDTALARLASFPKLRHLKLANTAVGDAGMEHLAPLAELEVLNLFGSRVGDAGLAHLQALEGLRRVYLSETQVTEDGLERLRAACPELEAVHMQLDEWLVENAPDAAGEPAEDAERHAACCDAAAAKGETCDHACCVEAALAGEVCEKCSA